MTEQLCAVITGASSGIGEALARRLAREGMSLVLGARRENLLQKLVHEISEAGGTAAAVRCDVTRRSDAEELVGLALRKFGRIDVLVNNAGRGHFASLAETTDDVVRDMFEVNVFALWHTVRPVLPHMIGRGSGHIFNMASLAGKIGFAYNSAYVAAKHAVVGFTHALRMELVETGVHATAVCPHGVLTDWAGTTEGGSMLPFFDTAGPIAARIARDRGIAPPQLEGLIPAERVADAVVKCLAEPVAEVFTHGGTEEFVRLAATNRAEAERRQLPGALAERAAYRQLRGDGGEVTGRRA